jgi:hypothetical protein
MLKLFRYYDNIYKGCQIVLGVGVKKKNVVINKIARFGNLIFFWVLVTLSELTI